MGGLHATADAEGVVAPKSGPDVHAELRVKRWSGQFAVFEYAAHRAIWKRMFDRMQVVTTGRHR
jgi:hypothetical protein